MKCRQRSGQEDLDLSSRFPFFARAVKGSNIIGEKIIAEGLSRPFQGGVSEEDQNIDMAARFFARRALVIIRLCCRILTELKLAGSQRKEVILTQFVFIFQSLAPSSVSAFGRMNNARLYLLLLGHRIEWPFLFAELSSVCQNVGFWYDDDSN